MDRPGLKTQLHSPAGEPVAPLVCSRCQARLEGQDNFCRHCGAPVILVVEPAEAHPWLENRWLLLFTLFVALGPLGLPLLWKARSLGPVQKTIVTFLVILESVVLGGVVWYLILWVWRLFQELG
jgi:hypothetical protein